MDRHFKPSLFQRVFRFCIEKMNRTDWRFRLSLSISMLCFRHFKIKQQKNSKEKKNHIYVLTSDNLQTSGSVHLNISYQRDSISKYIVFFFLCWLFAGWMRHSLSQVQANLSTAFQIIIRCVSSFTYVRFLSFSKNNQK